MEGLFDVTVRVYLASGFFNDQQLQKVEKTEGILRAKGLLVFSPREHQNESLPLGSREWRAETFRDDRAAILQSDVVVAIYDEQDAGTMWEIGFAYANQKPIVILHINEEPVNIMITESLHAYVDSFRQLDEYSFYRLRKIPYEGDVT